MLAGGELRGYCGKGFLLLFGWGGGGGGNSAEFSPSGKLLLMA